MRPPTTNRFSWNFDNKYQFLYILVASSRGFSYEFSIGLIREGTPTLTDFHRCIHGTYIPQASPYNAEIFSFCGLFRVIILLLQVLILQWMCASSPREFWPKIRAWLSIWFNFAYIYVFYFALACCRIGKPTFLLVPWLLGDTEQRFNRESCAIIK